MIPVLNPNFGSNEIIDYLKKVENLKLLHVVLVQEIEVLYYGLL